MTGDADSSLSPSGPPPPPRRKQRGRPKPRTPGTRYEWRVRFFASSAQVTFESGILTEQEARDLASDVQRMTLVVQRREVGPWMHVGTSATQRDGELRHADP